MRTSIRNIDLKRFFVAANLVEARLVCDRVRALGIEAHVFNEYADGAVGELPFTHTWPEVWLKRECDEDAARTVLEAHGRQADSDIDMVCEVCGESNPGNFEICWSCAASLTSV